MFIASQECVTPHSPCESSVPLRTQRSCRRPPPRGPISISEYCTLPLTLNPGIFDTLQRPRFQSNTGVRRTTQSRLTVRVAIALPHPRPFNLHSQKLRVRMHLPPEREKHQPKKWYRSRGRSSLQGNGLSNIRYYKIFVPGFRLIPLKPPQGWIFQREIEYKRRLRRSVVAGYVRNLNCHPG